MALNVPKSIQQPDHSADVALPTPEAWASVLNRLAALEGTAAGAGLYMRNGPNGRVIGAIPQPPNSIPLTISSVISGQPGRYNLKTGKLEANASASGALAVSDIATFSSTENAIGWNLREIAHGSSSYGHMICLTDPAQTTAWGYPAGATDTTSGFPIYIFGVDAGVQFAVTLANTSGSPSGGYVYTVSTSDGGATLATGVSPVWQPFNPANVNVVSPASAGQAHYSAAGALILDIAYEVWGTQSGCG